MSFSLQKTSVYRGYCSDELPLGAYALLLGTFATGTGALLTATRSRRARLDWSDLGLLGLATHKLTRLIARDEVTAVVRGPFTRFQGHAAASEVDEVARGTGLRKAVGQLLGCQYCLGPWVATALTFARILRPKQTRILATALGAVAVSDFLHRAFQMFGVELQQAYSERDLLKQAASAEAPPPPPRQPTEPATFGRTEELDLR
jgi:hypothetical protein